MAIGNARASPSISKAALPWLHLFTCLKQCGGEIHSAADKPMRPQPRGRRPTWRALQHEWFALVSPRTQTIIPIETSQYRPPGGGVAIVARTSGASTATDARSLDRAGRLVGWFLIGWLCSCVGQYFSWLVLRSTGLNRSSLTETSVGSTA